jgi:hypothetical protein
VAVSPSMDCMLTVGAMTVNLYKINSSNPETFSASVNLFSLVTDYIKTPIVIESVTRASKSVILADGCRVFKFIDALFVQDTNGTYKKSVLTTLLGNTDFLDSSIKYIIKGN